MKQWTGTVVVSYTQKISVAAENQEKAEAMMLDWFDPTYCLNTADGQVYDVVETQGETA